MRRSFNRSFTEWLQDFAGRKGEERGHPPDSTTGEMHGARMWVRPDPPDLRDWTYTPTLAPKRPVLLPSPNRKIIENQKNEGSCTGMASAAVINRILLANDMLDDFGPVSSRMLYEMARAHDEWEGAGYDGSSVRGAIKGFSHNGVCSSKTWPYRAAAHDAPDRHTLVSALNDERIREAKRVSLGSYCRLDPEMAHYHSALNEVGALICSAWVHDGWKDEKLDRRSTWNTGVIPLESDDKSLFSTECMHAFAVVGYTEKGFIIQNSWGGDWGGYEGMPGLALWTYEDWSINVVDAWVVTLGVSTPDSFALRPRRRTHRSDGAKAYRPRRQDVYPHYINLMEGALVTHGAYPSHDTDLDHLVDVIAETAQTGKHRNRPIRELLLFVHGGLIPIDTAVMRIADMREGYLRHGVFPVHVMWGNGPINVLFDLFSDAFNAVAGRMGYDGEGITDDAIEREMRFGGRAIWREIQEEADRNLKKNGPLPEFLRKVMDVCSLGNGLDLHILSYSAGAFLVGNILKSSVDDPKLRKALKQRLQTVDLIAPPCSVEYAAEWISTPMQTFLDGRETAPPIPPLKVHALSAEAEAHDRIGPYRGSLIEIVGRVFAHKEDGTPQDILGAAKTLQELSISAPERFGPVMPVLREIGGKSARSHFELMKDAGAMNDVLRRVSGDVNSAFRASELSDEL